MKIAIEDAILCLLGIKQYGNDTFTKRSQGDWQNSLDIAINTMRKYKKIEEIVKFSNANELGFEYVGEKITEVMEDGSN